MDWQGGWAGRLTGTTGDILVGFHSWGDREEPSKPARLPTGTRPPKGTGQPSECRDVKMNPTKASSRSYWGPVGLVSDLSDEGVIFLCTLQPWNGSSSPPGGAYTVRTCGHSGAFSLWLCPGSLPVLLRSVTASSCPSSAGLSSASWVSRPHE